MSLRRLLCFFILAASLSPPAFAQQQASGAITSTQCVTIAATQQSTVGIQVSGTWTGTLVAQVSVQGQPAVVLLVVPSTSSTPQATITGNGFYQAKVAGASTFLVCGNTVASGSASVYLNASTAVAVITPPASGSGNVISSPAQQVAFYPASAASVQGTSHLTDDGTTIAVTGSGGLNVNAGGGGGSPITSTGFGTLAALPAATSGIGFGPGGVLQGNINAGGWFPLLLASTNTLGANQTFLNYNDLIGGTEIFGISTASGPFRLGLCGTNGPQSFWHIGNTVPCGTISTNPQANLNIEVATGSSGHDALRLYAAPGNYVASLLEMNAVKASAADFFFWKANAGCTDGDTGCASGSTLASLDGTGFYAGTGLNIGGLDTLTANTLKFSGTSGLGLSGPVVATTQTPSVFNATSAVAQYLALKNVTPAIVGTSQSSPFLAGCGRGFHASADEEECFNWQLVPGNGNDAAGNINLTHTGAGTGIYTTNTPGPLKTGVGCTNCTSEIDMPGNTSIGAVLANNFSQYGPNSASFTGIGIQWPTTLTAGAFARVGTPASGISPITADFSDFTFAGTDTTAAEAPVVIQNTNSSNNNASNVLIVNAAGTSTGQIALVVNGSSNGHIVDFTTGGTVASNAISGQTVRVSIGAGGSIAATAGVSGTAFNPTAGNASLTLGGLSATANSTIGTYTFAGANNSSTGSNARATPLVINAGDLTGAATNNPGVGITLRPGLGTGNAKSAPIILGSQTFTPTSGTTAQTNVGTLIPAYKVAGSTTTGTATNLFNIALANNQTAAVKVIVHVETTQATPHNCSTTEEFVATAQDTGGTVTQQTTAGTIATICDTGTLTLAAAFSAAAPTVFSVTPSWATIVPTGVIISVQITNLSQQDITLL